MVGKAPPIPRRARWPAWTVAACLIVAAGARLALSHLAWAETGRGVKAGNSRQETFEPYRRKIALVVGIDRYENGIDPLEYAVEDAKAMGRMLADRYEFEVRALENEEATRQGIINAIVSLESETTADDQLLFFFAGHGLSFGEGDQESGYILPQDAHGSTQDKAWYSGIPMTELVGHLVRLPPRHLLILLDACYSGYAAMRPRGSREGQPEQLLRRLTSQPGRHLISAGKRGERTYESAEWKHSAFVAELLGALGQARADHNQDGLVTVSELYSDLLSAVPKRSRGAQTPHLATLDEEQGEFVFVHIPPQQARIANFPISPEMVKKCIPRSECCQVCTKGKACGNSCLKATYTCHKGRGCACDSSEVC